MLLDEAKQMQCHIALAICDVKLPLPGLKPFPWEFFRCGSGDAKDLRLQFSVLFDGGGEKFTKLI